MTRKTMNQKIAERFRQIQTDRLHEENSLRFDERREMILDENSQGYADRERMEDRE